MISVRELDDIQYVKDLLSRPGMGKLCSGNGEHVNPDVLDQAVPQYQIKFVLVEEDGTPRGFVAFAPSGDDSAFVHVALQTRGAKTLDAFTQALDFAHNALGYKEIHAVYPDRESLNHLGDNTGFSRPSEVDIGMGAPYIHRVKTFND
jgi:hypothetical protein